ncbi:MAG: NTP transferase domain-containing protein [Candidatus Eiseniibacteriota bacterium]|jgi:molybdopterin-guanine dinucleotide biosynthesis protein A
MNGAAVYQLSGRSVNAGTVPAHDGCLGAILVGGASRRMGADKALLDWHGRPLALAVAAVVRRVTPRVVLVGGAGRGYERLGLPVVPDPPGTAGRGPLAGLLAALGVARRRVLLVACDAPGWPAEALALLLGAACHADAVAFEADGQLEPLPGVFDVRLAPVVRRAMCGSGRLRDLFQRRDARRLSPGLLGAAGLAPGLTLNINQQSELLANPGIRVETAQGRGGTD